MNSLIFQKIPKIPDLSKKGYIKKKSIKINIKFFKCPTKNFNLYWIFLTEFLNALPKFLIYTGFFVQIFLTKLTRTFFTSVRFDFQAPNNKDLDQKTWQNKIQGQGPISSSLQQNFINVPQQMNFLNKRKRSTKNNVYALHDYNYIPIFHKQTFERSR